MDFMNHNLNQIKKKNKKALYGGIVVFALAILSFYWGYYIGEHTKDTGMNLHQIIASGKEEEGKIISLEVASTPYLFAEYDESKTSNKYYFLADQNYLYVGYLNYDTYQRLNKKNIKENPITIKGVTKKIPQDVIDIAIEVYNEELGEDFLTKENYKDYIGDIAIDTVSPLIDNIFQYAAGGILLIVGLILFIGYFLKQKRMNKALKSENWQIVSQELESANTISYDRFSLYLTPHYIVDGLKGLTIIPYEDIIWIYLFEQRYNGVVTNRNIMVITKDKKRKQIAGLSGLKKSKDIYTEMIEKIYEKNKAMLVGYTSENMKKIKDYK